MPDDVLMESRLAWYAVYVKSHHERKVAELLTGQGFTVFLPLVKVRSRRVDRQATIEKVLFPGYVFVELDISDGNSCRKAKKTPGVLHFVGYGDRPTPIPREQVESLQIAIANELKIDPYPYLKEGQRVEITSGPLKGMVGILKEKLKTRQRLVLSVDLMKQSVIVTIDACQVAPYV